MKKLFNKLSRLIIPFLLIGCGQTKTSQTTYEGRAPNPLIFTPQQLKQINDRVINGNYDYSEHYKWGSTDVLFGDETLFDKYDGFINESGYSNKLEAFFNPDDTEETLNQRLIFGTYRIYDADFKPFDPELVFKAGDYMAWYHKTADHDMWSCNGTKYEVEQITWENNKIDITIGDFQYDPTYLVLELSFVWFEPNELYSCYTTTVVVFKVV